MLGFLFKWLIIFLVVMFIVGWFQGWYYAIENHYRWMLPN